MVGLCVFGTALQLEGCGMQKGGGLGVSANILASIVTARLYSQGGWFLVGSGLVAFNCLALILLPAIKSIVKQSGPIGITLSELNENVSDDEHPQNQTPGCLRRMVFYIPDVVLFLNNVMYNVLVFDLTDRMVMFSGKDLDTAVLFMNLLNVFSFLSTLVLGYIADKNLFNIFDIMIFGNVAFVAGCVLAYGSTTKYLHFAFGVEIGSVLIGIGDAAIVNLSIVSKFVLYERWGLTVAGLGARSTVTNNLVLNLSVASGIVLSGFTLTEDSEITVLSFSAGIFILVSIGLILCRVVK